VWKGTGVKESSYHAATQGLDMVSVHTQVPNAAKEDFSTP